MKRFLLAGMVLSVALCWPAATWAESLPMHQVQLNGHTFTLPVGFDIELAAGPPLVDRPIEADFDEQGRLYVSDSSGTNERVEQQLKQKPHRILRLEDSKGTGKFDRRTVFADKMMFPEGVMWYSGSLYVAAVPSIWKLTDTKGAGSADQRAEWFQGKTLTGCANDLHGPYLGSDGWIYWCKGFFAEQKYERPNKQPFITRAAHIFRCRPDGSGIEPVMTGGMDNPVEVIFTPGGERIFTTTFLQHPAGGRRDGLIHAVYGGVYGKDHEVIYDHPWTAPSLMPVLVHLGPAAPCGLVRYESEVFGADYRDNLFACLFNMHKVTRHVLTPDGATFTARTEDFLVSDNADFHPTDVLEDADGSLLVLDTGGWYKLCCPTSQLHKPDVLGAIYRVRRHGAHSLSDPRGLAMAWSRMSSAQLASHLDDRRPAVRRRAIQALADKGSDALTSLETIIQAGRISGTPAITAEARRNAVWTATRIANAPARALVRVALEDADETVRQVALHSVSVGRDRDALPALLRLLKSPSLQNRRAAAEALGRIGDKTAIPALFEAIGEVGTSGSGTPASERVLEHSLTFALIELADWKATAAGLESRKSAIRRAALTALDQMPGSKLDPVTVAKHLNSSDVRLKETAWWIAGRHTEWGAALAGFLRDRLAVKRPTPAEQQELIGQLARFSRAAPIQEMLAEHLRDALASSQTRRIVLLAMARSNLNKPPASWVSALAEVLIDTDADAVAGAVAAARALRLPKGDTGRIAGELLRIGRDGHAPVVLRLNALASLPGGLTRVEAADFDFLRSQLDPEQPVAARSVAAEVVSQAILSPDQLLRLAEALKTISPMEIHRLLEAFAQSTEERVGRSLVTALTDSSARSGLRVELIKPRLAHFSAPVQRQAENLYALLDAAAAEQKARLEQLLVKVKDGDVRRGQAVFNSTKAACASCHAIGYLGGNIGPDLTHISSIRTERDLLESIVFPSASFVRSFEPVLVTTKAGKIHNGVVRKDTPDELVLAIGVNQEVHLAKNELDDIQPSKVSIMPDGFQQQLALRELADLLAFLKACK